MIIIKVSIYQHGKEMDSEVEVANDQQVTRREADLAKVAIKALKKVIQDYHMDVINKGGVLKTEIMEADYDPNITDD